MRGYTLQYKLGPHFSMTRARMLQLPNLAAVLVPLNVQRAVISLTIEVGSRHETPRTSGITHLLEHYLVTILRDEWQAEHSAQAHWLDGLNATTYTDHVTFDIEVAATDAWVVTAHLLKVLLPLKLDEQLLATERARVVDEIRRELTLEARMYRRMLSRHYYGSSSLALDSGGRPNVLQRLTIKQLQEWHSTFFQPSRMSLIVVGPEPTVPQLRILDELLLGTKTGGAIPELARFRPVSLGFAMEPYRSREISVMWNGFYPGTPDLPTWALLAHVLDQVVRRPLSDAGYTYSVTQTENTDHDFADLSLDVSLVPEVASKYQADLNARLNDLTKRVRDPKQVSRWRDELTQLMALHTDDPWAHTDTARWYLRLTGHPIALGEERDLIARLHPRTVLKLWQTLRQHELLLIGGAVGAAVPRS